MPIISSYAKPESFREDQDPLMLYALSGEKNGGSVTFRPQISVEMGKALFFQDAITCPMKRDPTALPWDQNPSNGYMHE